VKKNTDRHFWLKLHYKDWRNSQGLMRCSMQARGVAIEAEMLMKQSPRPGMLLLNNGEPVSVPMFARLAQADVAEVQAGMDELIAHGEIEVIAGVFYSQRVALAMEQSDTNSENARHRWPRNATRKATRKAKKRKVALRPSVSVSDSDFSQGDEEEESRMGSGVPVEEES
jgi:hypothetical protein